MVRIAWHGGAACTLDIGGHEVLVDPVFARDGPWCNPHAPTAYEYMASHRPERVVLTSGEPDHCDLDTLRALMAIRPLELVCSPAVAAQLTMHGAVGPEHLTAVAPDTQRRLDHLRIDVFRSAPPSPDGARGLGLLVQAGDECVYVSGDTSVDSLPEAPSPVAVLCVGVSSGPDDPARAHTLMAEDVPAAVRRLHARALVPVEWDLPFFADALDVNDLRDRVAAEAPACAVASPAYNTWTYIE